MTEITEDDILAALAKIEDTERGADIVSLGMIGGISVDGGRVRALLEIPPERAEEFEPLRAAAERAVAALPGVVGASVVLTAHRKAAPAEAAPPNRPSANKAPPRSGAPRERVAVPGVAAIVAVASGKGGVGKSTVSVNLALALSGLGARVAILDADVYGPSMPRMLGITGRPTAPDGKTMNPLENYGIKCMSIGFLVDEDRPTIWRGPMVTGALDQMLRQVAWGDIDIMVVDMPPGTGDVQLSLAQGVPLAGAVIVSTPQDIALLDARKGLNMFRQVEVPVFGIVENMSYFVCPHCGERSDIFGHGGARAEADKLGVDFLGEVPLDIAIRETSDSGRPIVATDPESPHSEAFRRIAEKVRDAVAGPRMLGR
ncbi:MAG: iron-sulfur cluster carrier protein ApbC [Alphaproteobacteria bacterium]